MAVKIRLMRIGAKGRPFYRVVAVDERKKRTGSYLELLGTYNPLTTPKEIILKQDRIDAWVKNGAQLSDGFLRIIGKAKQKPARKPKKDRGGNEAQAAAPEAPAAEEKPQEAAEETTENAPETTVEEVKPSEETVEEKTTETDNTATEQSEAESATTDEETAEEEK